MDRDLGIMFDRRMGTILNLFINAAVPNLITLPILFETFE